MLIPGSPVYYAAATLIGAAVGFMSGLLGKGGSAVTTPALRVLLGVPRFYALASPLPTAIPTTLSASWAYRGRGLIDWPAFWITCAWGIPATIAGSLASHAIGGHFLMQMTALVVISLGVAILFHRERGAAPAKPESGVSGSKSAPEADPAPETGATGRLVRLKLTLIALGVGFLSGLLANTGGVFFAPLFIKWARMETKRALATSLIVSAVLAVPGTMVHAWLGHIDWALVLALSLGALPFSYLGARLAIRMHSVTLLRVYGITLTLFGIYDLLYTERVEIARLFAGF